MTPKDFCELTLAELEALTKVSQGRWSLYINKKQSPTFRTLNMIADMLSMSTEQLIQSINMRSDLKLPRGRRSCSKAKEKLR